MTEAERPASSYCQDASDPIVWRECRRAAGLAFERTGVRQILHRHPAVLPCGDFDHDEIPAPASDVEAVTL